MTSILPPNSTTVELSIEASIARIGDVPVPNASLWNPATCPSAFLPWLAFALSVDDWDTDWTDETKRAVITASIEVHRRKGTIGALRAALTAAGFGSAEIIEQFGWNNYDAVHLYDGSITYAARDHWAEYRLKLQRPLTAAQATRVQAILKSVTPARCHLKEIAFYEVDHTYNAAILHDGAYKYGEP